MNNASCPMDLSRCELAAALSAMISLVGASPDLTAISLEELMALKVIGASKYEQRQSEVAASVGVLTRQDIRSFGWRPPTEPLANLPGIHVTPGRRYSLERVTFEVNLRKARLELTSRLLRLATEVLQ